MEHDFELEENAVVGGAVQMHCAVVDVVGGGDCRDEG